MKWTMIMILMMKLILLKLKLFLCIGRVNDKGTDNEFDEHNDEVDADKDLNCCCFFALEGLMMRMMTMN